MNGFFRVEANAVSVSVLRFQMAISFSGSTLLTAVHIYSGDK